MKTKYILHCTFVCLAFLWTGGFAFAQVPWYQREVRTEAHDPTMIRDSRGVYTMMSTNNLLTIRQSDNGTTWTNRGRIFNSMPAWIATSLGEPIENIWAPHITFRNNRYWVYYCASSFGTNKSVIGVASNPTLDVNSAQYAWTDHGEVIKTGTSNNYNAIDPELIADKQGRLWMSFGSWWTGIKMVEIDPATGKRLASNTTVYSLASRGGSGIEGPSIIENNGYYYLFTAWDVCCQGTSSTYRTMVGRSTSITGPYVDKQGRSLMNNFAEQVLGTYGRYIGQGGGSAFQNGRRKYFAHHYYNSEENGAARIQAREIVWGDDGWPVVTQPFLGRRLSLEAEHSVIVNSAISKSTTASNDEYITMSNTDSRATFYVNALAAGNYRLRIRYAATSAATQFAKVNTGAEVTVQFPSTGTTATFPEAQVVYLDVTFKKGANVIVLRKGANSIQLDRVDILRFATSEILSGTFEDSRSVTYELPDSQSVRMMPSGWMLFENVNFGTGGNSNLNLVFNGSGSGTMEVRIDGVTGSTFQSYSIASTSAQPSQNFTTSSSLTGLTGIHDVYILNKNTSGDLFLKSFKFGVASNQPPTVSITSPANNTSFIAPASITLNANASDADGTITIVQFYQGSTLLGSDAVSPYSFSWTNVAAGTYSVTARATDNSGNITTSTSVTLIVTNPNQLPTISVILPANNAVFTAPAGITFNATATDADGTISNVQFYQGTTLLGSDATAPYSFLWTNVAAGTYTITAQAADNSGGIATSSPITVVVNPSINGFTLQAETACSATGVLSESSNAGFNGTGYVNLDNATGSSAYWTVNSSMAQTTTLYIRYANGSANNRNMSLAVNGATQLSNIDFVTTGAWTTWNMATMQVSLTSGWNRIDLVSLTSEGAPNIDELILSASTITMAPCVKPNELPSVEVTSPANNAAFTAPAAITINASASDADGTVTKVEFYQGTVLIGSDATFPYAIAWNDVAPGNYSITAVATDNSGAVTTSSVVLIHVNAPNLSPLISITSPSDNSEYTAFATITITANASDPDGTIANVQFFNGAALLETDAATPYTFTWTNVDAGTYTIFAKATDNNGAITTASVTVTVETPIPPSTIQCETACEADGQINENINTGFNGTGYVNTDNRIGARAAWSINSPISQTVMMTIRYAHDTPAGRPMTISINGTIQSSNISFPSTGSVTSWQTINVSLSLNSGDNAIVLSALSAAGSPYLDEFTLDTESITIGQCSVLSGIRSNSGFAEANVSPNPSSEWFNLSVNKHAEYISVRDMKGAEVFTYGNLSKGEEIRFGHDFAEGVYNFVIRYSDGTLESVRLQKAL